MTLHRQLIQRKIATLLVISVMLGVAQSRAQDCVDTIANTFLSENYRVNNNGTIQDIRRNIVWMQCSIGQTWQNGQCTGTAQTMTWQEALLNAQTSQFASHQDWRIPTLHELSSITELRCQQPAIDLRLFPESPPLDYWTANTFVNNPDLAWLVHFAYGENHTTKKSAIAAIRLVRSANH
ncbi:Lcl C-terminal domain-containing protein [Kaarinaea lacus]